MPRPHRHLFPLSSVRVENWQADNGISDFETAELDLRLEAALQAIYADQDLRSRLAWKGGTAINKLFLADDGQYRLSVDLDFNAIGKKEDVTRGEFRQRTREHIVDVLGALDPSSTLKVAHWTYFKDEVQWCYSPLAMPGREAAIKIEISTVERFSILGYQEIARPWAGLEPVPVLTMPVEELLATKIRAFYDRRKGRDVYDLYRVLENYKLNLPRLRKMVLYYFFRSGHEFRPAEFFGNIDQKLASREYGEDIRPYLRGDDHFAWQEAGPAVRRHLSFLEDLDERDRQFLLVARDLLGKEQLPQRWIVPPGAARPLAWLLEGCDVHPGVSTITLDDVRPYRPGRSSTSTHRDPRQSPD